MNEGIENLELQQYGTETETEKPTAAFIVEGGLDLVVTWVWDLMVCLNLQT